MDYSPGLYSSFLEIDQEMAQEWDMDSDSYDNEHDNQQEYDLQEEQVRLGEELENLLSNSNDTYIPTFTNSIDIHDSPPIHVKNSGGSNNSTRHKAAHHTTAQLSPPNNQLKSINTIPSSTRNNPNSNNPSPIFISSSTRSTISTAPPTRNTKNSQKPSKPTATPNNTHSDNTDQLNNVKTPPSAPDLLAALHVLRSIEPPNTNQPPTILNPFIPLPLITPKRTSTLFAASLIPVLPILKGNYKPTSGDMGRIVEDAVRMQDEVRHMFRSIAAIAVGESAGQVHMEGLLHQMQMQREQQMQKEQQMQMQKELQMQRQVSTPIPQQASQSSHRKQKNIQGYTLDDEARQERLASLGIFEVDPKTRYGNGGSMKASGVSIEEGLGVRGMKAFATPSKVKPKKVNEIGVITAPTLISTSSRMMTVPISEILKDLRASGRLIELESEKEQKEKERRRLKGVKVKGGKRG